MNLICSTLTTTKTIICINYILPLKNSGIHIGKTTASSNNLFASLRSAMSSQRMFGFLCTMSLSKMSANSLSMPWHSNFFSSSCPFLSFFSALSVSLLSFSGLLFSTILSDFEETGRSSFLPGLLGLAISDFLTVLEELALLDDGAFLISDRRAFEILDFGPLLKIFFRK